MKYFPLSKDDAACLLVDHQSGLISSGAGFLAGRVQEQRAGAGGDRAKYFKLPTILTTSFENGPNGPLVPELKEMFPDAPYIARPGNINAWDNEDFVKAVQETGTQAADHRRRGDRGLRGFPGALRHRGGLRGVRRHRCIRHVQRRRRVTRRGRGWRRPARN